MYKVLIKSDAADEFFRLLLTPENRTYFRNQFQEAEAVKAYGCSVLSECSRITRNNKVLTIYTDLLPSGITIEYHNSNVQLKDYDKLLLWEVFPAEDNEGLEKKVYKAYNEKRENSFFQIDILLYNGNVKTASTDLKSGSESLEEAKNNCKDKYRQCSVYAVRSEEDFKNKLLYILVPLTFYRKEEIFGQIKYVLTQKEEDLQYFIDEYKLNMGFLFKADGVLSSEELYSVCDWKNVASRDNIADAYFDAFTVSAVYKSIIDEIVSYYREFITDICIWDEKEDCYNLKNRITNELIKKKKFYNRPSVPAPENRIKYKSEIYTAKMLEFNKAVSSFFSDDVKNILFSHIIEKIKTYRGLLQ